MERSPFTFIRATVAPVATWMIVGISILLCHPAILSFFTSRFIGGSEGDAGLYIWLCRSFYEDPVAALTFQTNGFYPYPLTRAWSDNFILPSALVSLLYRTGVPFVVSYNSVVLLVLLLNGLCTAKLARVLGLGTFASLFSGIAFANASYFTGNLGHPQLQYVFWVPLAISLVGGSSSFCSWCLAGLCVSGAFLSAVYYAVFAAVSLVSFWIAVTVRTTSIRTSVRAVAAMALGISPSIPFVLPYLRVKEAFGKRELYEAYYFAADTVSYLTFAPFDLLYGFTSTWSHSEAALSPGLVALTLGALSVAIAARTPLLLCTVVLSFALVTASALCGVPSFAPVARPCTALLCWFAVGSSFVNCWNRRTPASALAVLTLVAFSLSLGPLANPAKGSWAFSPYAVAHAFVPGMDSVRAVARFGSVVLLCVYLSAFVTLERLSERLKYPSVLLLSGGLLLILIENYNLHFPLDDLPPRPQAFDAVRKTMRPGEATLVLPYARDLKEGQIGSWSDFATLNTHAAIWAAESGLTVVNGYSGQRSKFHNELPLALSDFPSARSLNWIGRICGVRHIIVLPTVMPDWNEGRFAEQLGQLGGRVSLKHRMPDGSLALEFDSTFQDVQPNPTWFSPQGRPVTFQYSLTSNERANPLPLVQLVRQPSGTIDRIPLVSSRFSPTDETIRVVPSANWAALPSVIELRGSLPAAALSCSVPPDAD